LNVGVFVLGMHRSGTSVATRLVNLLGIPTARDDDLVPPSRDNPTGFWESSSLVVFNERLLSAVGSELSCPVALDPGWERDHRLDGFYREGRQIFRRAFPHEPWVWKDPRNCLTLPFWLRALDVSPVVVLIHRNPLEIAESYRVRYAEEKEYSFALWERYVRQALGALSELPVLVTSYERLVASPVDWCRQMSSFLVHSGIPVDPIPEPEVLGFVDSASRHVRFTRSDFEEDDVASEAQQMLFRTLENLAEAHDRFSAPQLVPETAATEVLLSERRRAVREQLERKRTPAEGPGVFGRVPRSIRNIVRPPQGD
jgi:hypothetical protein